jgi:hypothetical protein
MFSAAAKQNSQQAGYCRHRNKPQVSIKAEEFPDQMNETQLRADRGYSNSTISETTKA